MSRFRFIAAEKAQHPVVTLCRVLGVSPSGSDAWVQRQPSARAQADVHLLKRVRTIHTTSNCTYGAPRVHAELRATGIRVGHKRVARLMRPAGLAGRCPKRFRRTTIPADTPAAQPPDLVQRQFLPCAPNRLWVADNTYVRTWEGWLYLAVVLDAFSRRVVGWALPNHVRAEWATDALDMALTSRRPGRWLVSSRRPPLARQTVVWAACIGGYLSLPGRVPSQNPVLIPAHLVAVHFCWYVWSLQSCLRPYSAVAPLLRPRHRLSSHLR